MGETLFGKRVRDYFCVCKIIVEKLSSVCYITHTGGIYMFFTKKTQPIKDWDRDNLTPVIRSSICTGERVAGFLDKTTGKFRDVQLLITDKDLDDFRKTYGITEEIKTVY
jgi:hypothetical protein